MPDGWSNTTISALSVRGGAADAINAWPRGQHRDNTRRRAAPFKIGLASG
jgi:hypothetical protein